MKELIGLDFKAKRGVENKSISNPSKAGQVIEQEIFNDESYCSFC